MVQLIREYLERRRLRKASPEARYAFLLEARAKEFIAAIPLGPDGHEARINEAFRLARVWISQVERGRG
jgi:hypothetical protein